MVEDATYEERKAYAPLILFEYDHKRGSYCLMLSDNHMVDVMEVFEANGQYGNGYGWEGVARSAIHDTDKGLLERMGFDPEAGTFVAYGEDLAALQKLAELLHQAFHDQERLAYLIKNGNPDWFD